MILKYKQLVLCILNTLILLKSTNAFAGKDKEAEELNHSYPSSSNNTPVQLIQNFEKSQSTTRPPRKRLQNNPRSSFVRLDNPSVDNVVDQAFTTSISASYSATSQETTAFNINNFPPTYCPSIAAEKKGANFLDLALFYSERSKTPYAKSKDIEKCSSYCRKALKIEAFRTSAKGLALIETLSATSEGSRLLQSVECLHKIPTKTLPTQILPAQTSLSPCPVGRLIPIELPYHPLNTPTALPTIQASTSLPQNIISLPPFQIPFVLPSAISGVPHVATNNLGQFFQGANISSSPSFYQAPMPMPLFPSLAAEFTCDPVNLSPSSSSASYNPQKEPQDLYNINAKFKQLQTLSQNVEKLQKNYRILNSLQYGSVLGNMQ